MNDKEKRYNEKIETDKRVINKAISKKDIEVNKMFEQHINFYQKEMTVHFKATDNNYYIIFINLLSNKFNLEQFKSYEDSSYSFRFNVKRKQRFDNKEV